MTKQELLRSLPKIDKLAQDVRLASYVSLSPDKVNDVLRGIIDSLRQGILSDSVDVVPNSNTIITSALISLDEWRRNTLAPLVNATGVVLHTNFGRSPIAQDVVSEAADVCSNYSNLEYDIDEGVRKSRTADLERAICELTGAEAALVVNNNVAGLALSLHTLSAGKSVILSRGEMVEIGGSSRLPEIINAAGCKLYEVGTTNVSRISDYDNAIDENRGVILKVNQSNFAFVGYSEEVGLDKLVKLAHDNDMPCVYDMGSGVIYSLQRIGIDEMTVSKALETGVDLVTFSCDKLLGGPQAGVIAGKKHLVDAIRKNPLLRTVRVDKFTIATLEATLRRYDSFSHATSDIPTLHMLMATRESLQEDANKMRKYVIDKMDLAGFDANEIGNMLTVEDVDDTPGGGCSPTCVLEGSALVLHHDNPQQIVDKLRHCVTPIIALCKDKTVVFSLRTILPQQHNLTAQSIADVLGEILLGETNA